MASVVPAYRSILDTVTPTPLIDVSDLFSDAKVEVWMKYEANTPTGSHKYRAALSAIRSAIACRELNINKTAVVPTGGNYGLAAVILCRAQGIKCILAIPDNYPKAKLRILEAAGAEIRLADHNAGANAHGILATEIFWSDPNRYYLLDQFSDPANVDGHVPTGHEIIAALGDTRIDLFVAGIGSGASLTGIARTLKQHWPHVLTIGVQPIGCDVLTGICDPNHGIPGLAVGGPPANLDKQLVDEMETVSLGESVGMAKGALRQCGISIGLSSGANLVAIGQIARRAASPATIVTLAYDRIDAYLDVVAM